MKSMFEVFEAAIGKSGVISGDSFEYPVVLNVVKPVLRAESSQHQTGFSIEVNGSPDKYLQQNTYTFEIEGVDVMDIFFVPVAPGTYEAIFN